MPTTIYRDEIYELTTERKNSIRNAVWQMLWSDSYLTVSKNAVSPSTSSSDIFPSLWAIHSLCWEGHTWDCTILKLRERTAHYMNFKVFLPCHHSHSLMLTALHSGHSSPVCLGPHTLYSAFIKDQALRVGWTHKRETRLQEDRAMLEEQSWSPAAWADLPIPFLASSVHLVKAPNFTELQLPHLRNRNKHSILSRHTEQLVNTSC